VTRHNPSVGRPSSLTLSAVADGAQADADTLARVYVRPHIHDRRLCPPCVVGRFIGLNPRPRRQRHSPELVAQSIRAHGGDVLPAVVAFGVSYRHACRIRAGWRPGGRRSVPIPYESAGWSNGQRIGAWSAQDYREWAEPELRLAWGDR
jgi:hypothetical protein